MADPLYLSLWYSSFEAHDMLPHLLPVLRHFPFSEDRPGITYVALHPVDWQHPTVLEQRLNPGFTPEQAILLAADMIHDDYAYSFEAYWDLWVLPEAASERMLAPTLVRFVVHGVEFDEGIYRELGHIQVDLGLDAPFLQEEVELTSEAESSVRANVKKLIDFTNSVQKSADVSNRLLWSESEETLAQKLIARLQRFQ